MTFKEFCDKNAINAALIAGHSGIDPLLVKRLVEGTYPHKPRKRTIRDITIAIERLTGKKVDVSAMIDESKRRAA